MYATAPRIWETPVIAYTRRPGSSRFPSRSCLTTNGEGASATTAPKCTKVVGLKHTVLDLTCYLTSGAIAGVVIGVLGGLVLLGLAAY